MLRNSTIPSTDIPLDEDNDNGWAERGEYWRQLNVEVKQRGRKPRFLHQPLILTGHGIKIRVDRGTLLIRNGFTHYPQELEEYRFFPRDRRLPSRIAIIDGDGGITLGALEWLSIQGVSLVQINWRGDLVNVGSGFGYGADPDILRSQIKAQDGPFSLSFARYLIENKIEHSITTIREIFEPSPAAELTVSKLQERLKLIRNRPPGSVAALLNAEAIAGAAYFRCWHSKPLQWKKIAKKLIPDDWHRIGARMTDDHSNQFARHPVNAMLNYAYAMLESQVRTITLGMGFDPTISYLHAYEINRVNLIFDLMEPLRPIIDRKILEFVQDHVFSPADFTLSNMGVCKLHPQFARIIVKLIQDLPEVKSITINNLNKLMALHPAIAKKAGRNITVFKSRLAGRRK